MAYKGMPLSWISYYKDCFTTVNDTFSLHLDNAEIEQSVKVLKEYNPRYHPREIEYSSEFLFKEATAHWNTMVPIDEIISVFFSGMKLSAEIYCDTMPVLNQLKENGYTVAALTNLPSSMPDSLFKSDIPQILEIIDLYVSSEICGYRKPNKAGLEYIANYYNIDSKDLIFVGDEKLDIDTARNSGCTSILICRDHEYQNYNQDHTIESLQDLFSICLPV